MWDGNSKLSFSSCAHGGEVGGSHLRRSLSLVPQIAPLMLILHFKEISRRVFVGLLNHDSRIFVLESMLDHVLLDPHFDLGLMASRTGGYSHSDIREVLQAAALYPMREACAEAIFYGCFKLIKGIYKNHEHTH